MSDKSGIEWTDTTWNPVRGCSEISEGCRNCYAMRDAWRMAYPGGPYDYLVRHSSKGPVWTGQVRLIEAKLDEPLRWRTGRRIFVNSMSDLFHERLTFDQITRVMDTVRASPQHVYQILTKRADRMIEFLNWYGHTFRRRVQFGVSVENVSAWVVRVPILLQLKTGLRWVSAEPLLEPLLTAAEARSGNALLMMRELAELDWLVIGGESGPKARPCSVPWIETLIDATVAQSVPVFVKQLGGHPDKRGGDKALIRGALWRQYPDLTHE